MWIGDISQKSEKDVNYTPNKKTVLAFAIALELSIDEAKDLLNSAGFAFSRSSKTDIIVAYFLQNKIYDMFEINEILDAYGQPIFVVGEEIVAYHATSSVSFVDIM